MKNPVFWEVSSENRNQINFNSVFHYFTKESDLVQGGVSKTPAPPRFLQHHLVLWSQQEKSSIALDFAAMQS